jgi:secretion/DNA translocation related TadE-like protein
VRPQTWTLSERGSGTVLALGLMAMLVILFGLVQIPIREVVAKARAQVVADQAALAGADSLRGLATGIPCDVVALLVARSNYENVTCRVVSNSVYVSLRISPLIVAEARAGI